jgi:hypothetical protein
LGRALLNDAANRAADAVAGQLWEAVLERGAGGRQGGGGTRSAAHGQAADQPT